MALTEKQRRFVEAYMGKAQGNGTEAARVAGYGGDDATLASIASENLRRPAVRAAIVERVANDSAVADRQECQRFWTATMRAESAELRDRLRASELLAKSQGVFVDRVEQTVATRQGRLPTDDELRAIAALALEDIPDVTAPDVPGLVA